MNPKKILKNHFNPKPNGELARHTEIPNSEVRPNFATEIARKLSDQKETKGVKNACDLET